MDNLVSSILFGVIGIVVGFLGMMLINHFKGNNANKKAEVILEKARKEAEKNKREMVLEAKEEIHKLKLESEKENRERKQEIKDLENRLSQREDNIDKRDLLFQKREEALDEREAKLIDKQSMIQTERAKVEELKQKQIKVLNEISGISKEEARKMVMDKVRETMSKEIASYIRDRENEAKLECDKKARELLVSSMQKYASDVASLQTVTVVNLPNDEMKGRIIGREGRNIRTIEAITGDRKSVV